MIFETTRIAEIIPTENLEKERKVARAKLEECQQFRCKGNELVKKREKAWTQRLERKRVIIGQGIVKGTIAI